MNAFWNQVMSELNSTVADTWRISYNGDAFVMPAPNSVIEHPMGWHVPLVYEKPTAPGNRLSYTGADPVIRNAAGIRVAPFEIAIPFP